MDGGETSPASDEAPAGGLTVVATPIGNLDDITLRALKTLEQADLILAEDTRHSRKLLNHHGIRAPLRAYHAHTPASHIEALISQMQQGSRLALISDAGTPLISDPGSSLVAAARDAGLAVTAAPGVSAVITAVSIAGLRADRFRFIGFVPRQGKRRRLALEAIATHTDAVVLFESPRRLTRLLDDLAPKLGNRRIAVCRELTKLHEEVARGTAEELAVRFAAGARGEICVVIEALGELAPRLIDEDERAEWLQMAVDSTLHPREVAKTLAGQLQLSRSEAYTLIREAKETASSLAND